MATLNFLPTANQKVVTDMSKSLLLQIAAESNNDSISISSTVRSPYEQAKVMYQNCVSLGIKSQYKLYAKTGDKVIDVYKKMAYQKLHNRAEVIKAMMNKINEIGPTKVSKHCVDTTVMNVLDIPFSSVKYKAAFKREVMKHHPLPIIRLLDETKNNCFHIEINLKALQNMNDSSVTVMSEE